MEKTDNELIAEFIPEFMEEQNWHKLHWKDAPFAKSWDWLMPVVEKILSIDHSEFNYNVSGMVQFRTEREKVTSLKITVPRKMLYDSVVAFIKWYSLNSKAEKE